VLGVVACAEKEGGLSSGRWWDGEQVCAYPDVEIEVLICDGLYIEAYCRYCGYHFANLE